MCDSVTNTLWINKTSDTFETINIAIRSSHVKHIVAFYFPYSACCWSTWFWPQKL